METKVNYTVVGLFVVILTLAIIVAGFWITSRGKHKLYNIYAVNMEEPVSGLNVQAPVKFNGVNVGYVSNISLDPNDPQRVHLLLKIQQGTPITQSTTATLMMQGITGVAYVGLRALTAQAPILEAQPGQPYPVIKWAPSVLVELDTTIRDMTTSFKSISLTFGQVFSEQNQESIKQSLASIAKFTNVLAANSKNINQILQNSAVASQKFPETMQQLQATLAAAKIATQKLAQASDTASSTLRTGRTTMQNISQQALPSTVDAINKLNNVLNSLQELTNQLQNNPSILVRGAQPKPLGPGER